MRSKQQQQQEAAAQNDDGKGSHLVSLVLALVAPDEEIQAVGLQKPLRDIGSERHAHATLARLAPLVRACPHPLSEPSFPQDCCVFFVRTRRAIRQVSQLGVGRYVKSVPGAG